ncbi:hypothetical protein BGZ72_010617 [Mortierella alpina]|nr:hypothetical protein BGZ72_010617 [Mortierella alpina]
MTRVKSFLLIAAILVLHIVQGVPLTVENDIICDTPDCEMLSEAILSDMDPQVDPCVDFSAYACGGYEAFEDIPAHRNMVDNFDATIDQNMAVMRSILEPDSPGPISIIQHDPVAQQNLKKLRDLYASCMNEDRFERLGRKPLVTEIQMILQLFPVSDSLFPSLQSPAPSGTNVETLEDGLNKTGLSLTLSYFNRLGLSNIARIMPAINSDNASSSVLGLLEGGSGLSKPKYYLDQGVAGMYKSTIAKMFNLIMGDEADDGRTMALMSNSLPETMLPSHWEDAAQDVFDFEKQLSEAYTDIAQLMESAQSETVHSIDNVSNLTPSIDWQLLLDDLLPANVRRTHPISVASPSYQERLELLLQTTKPRTLQAYFVWTIIRQMAQNIAPEYEAPFREFRIAVNDTPTEITPDRWKRCVEVVNWNLGQMGGYFFLSERYNDGSHALVSDMVDSIRSIYEQIFPSLSWLDAMTMAGAFEKLKAMLTVVGFSRVSPNAQSSESLRSYYEGFHVDPDRFFENDLQFRRWRSAAEYRMLEVAVDSTNMPFSPQTVNAYFDVSANRILLPAGMLQPTFFHAGYPEYVNYGSLGSIIGHEFTHAFDNSGHHYDGSGKQANVSEFQASRSP